MRSTPKTSNGVVTYQTVLTVDNSERLLQPGMTATAEITVTQVHRRGAGAERGAAVHAASGIARTPEGFRFLPTAARASAGEIVGREAPAARLWTLSGQELESSRGHGSARPTAGGP